jgi:hypothetical protein
LRAEWFRDEELTRVLPIRATELGEGGNFFELTLGVNWRPVPRMLVRPELRWDHSDVAAPTLGIGGVYDVFRRKDQLTMAIDMVLLF